MERTRATPSAYSRLALATVNIAGFRKRLLDLLGATSVSALRFTIRLNLTPEERLRYLHPIRDIFSDTGWVEGETKEGAKVAIVGSDVKAMVNRIRDPTRFWVDRELNVWLAVVRWRECDSGAPLEPDFRATLEPPQGLSHPKRAGTWELIDGFYTWCPYTAAGSEGLTVWHYSDHVGRCENWFESSASDPLTSLESGVVKLASGVPKEKLLGKTNGKRPHTVGPTVFLADLTRSTVLCRTVRPFPSQVWTTPPTDGTVALHVYQNNRDYTVYPIVLHADKDTEQEAHRAVYNRKGPWTRVPVHE